MRAYATIGALILVFAAVVASAADRQAVKQLAAALTSGDAAAQHAAADALADLGYAGQEAVPELTAALQSRDADLRWRAARALGVIGDPQSILALRKQADDNETVVRAQAIFALGRLKAADEESLKTIVAKLGDADAQVRRASIRALRMIEAPRQNVTPLIVKLLSDPDPAIAMRALSTVSEGGVEVVPALTSALEQKESRYWACIALGEMGPQAKDAAAGLVKVLSDERPEIRLQAAIALGEIGPDAQSAVSALVKMLEDPIEAVRPAVVFALGRIADPAAGPALAKTEQSTDPVLHMLSTWSLARIYREDAQRMNEAMSRLVTSLGDKNPTVVMLASKALGDLEIDPNAVRPLIDRMVAAHPEMSDRVLNAFASLGPRGVPQAIEALKDPQRRVRAMQSLSRMGPEAAAAVPHLVELLKSGDAATKVEVLFALGAIGPGAAIAVVPISEQLAASDPQIIQAATYALGKIGPTAKEAVPALLKLTGSEDDLLQMTSVWAVLRIGPRTDDLVKAAVPILASALKNPREFVRVEAAMTLGDLGPSAAEALPALQSAATDLSAAVRSAVDAAIKKIKGQTVQARSAGEPERR